jgi:predicted nucleic-acid-binding Zn-ribbon protein
MMGRDIRVHNLEEKHGIPVVNCLRCGYKWVPRHLNKPRSCPKCGSHHWDEPKIEVKQSKLKREPTSQSELCDDDACDSDNAVS